MSMSCVTYATSIQSIRDGLWDLTEYTFKSGCTSHESDYLFDPLLGVQSAVHRLGLPTQALSHMPALMPPRCAVKQVVVDGLLVLLTVRAYRRVSFADAGQVFP